MSVITSAVQSAHFTHALHTYKVYLLKQYQADKAEKEMTTALQLLLKGLSLEEKDRVLDDWYAHTQVMIEEDNERRNRTRV